MWEMSKKFVVSLMQRFLAWARQHTILFYLGSPSITRIIGFKNCSYMVSQMLLSALYVFQARYRSGLNVPSFILLVLMFFLCRFFDSLFLSLDSLFRDPVSTD